MNVDQYGALIEARADLAVELIKLLELTYRGSAATRQDVNDAADALEDGIERLVEEWRRVAGEPA